MLPVSPICLVLPTEGPCALDGTTVFSQLLSIRGSWSVGTSLPIGFCVSPGGNVDYICFFIQEVFIEATIMNKADKVPVSMELYC